MDDLLGGVNDWRNIQDVVRQTFKALHDVVRSQGEKLRELEMHVAGAARTDDLEALGVAVANKPTFVEMGKQLATRVEELNLGSLRAQLAAKADKAELKDLYSDMTVATQRLGDSTNALELLVRQQQSEIEQLKRELRKLGENRQQEAALQGRHASKKWVEDCLAFERDARKQNLGVVKRELQTALGELRERVEEIPSVATLDEVFAQKVDMNTLTRALQDRPTGAQVSKEVAGKLGDMAASLLEQANEAMREAAETVLASAREEMERLEDKVETRVSRGELLELCGEKVGHAEFEERLGKAADQLASEVKQAMVGIQRELVQVLNKKAFKADVAKSLQAKANLDDVQAWLASKAELVDVRDSLAYKADLSLVQEALNRMEALEGSKSRAAARRQRARQRGREKLRALRRKTKRATRERAGLQAYLDTDDARSSGGAGYESDSLRDGAAGARRRGPRGDDSDSDWLAREAEDDGDDGLGLDDYDDLDDGGPADVDGAGEDWNGAQTEEMAWKLRILAEQLRKMHHDKVSVKDFCALLDQKANTRDVNDALAKLGAHASGGPRKAQAPAADETLVARLQQQVSSLADAINAELSTGRWIWSAGRTLPDRAVPWNIECINTATDNLLWKQDAADITAVVPGLYEVHLGFFTPEDPEVQLLVNGEPIFYTARDARQAAAARRGNPASALQRVQPWRRARHSAGNVTGWTAADFVALPARARITVLYEGEAGTQGFLALRKL